MERALYKYGNVWKDRDIDVRKVQIQSHMSQNEGREICKGKNIDRWKGRVIDIWEVEVEVEI